MKKVALLLLGSLLCVHLLPIGSIAVLGGLIDVPVVEAATPRQTRLAAIARAKARRNAFISRRRNAGAAANARTQQEPKKVLDQEAAARAARMQKLRQQRALDRVETKKAVQRRRSSNSLQRQVIDLVNLERTAVGLSQLRYNARLTNAAQLHADDMRDRDYFSHDTPEGVGPGKRIGSTGYTDTSHIKCNCRITTVIGENIALGQPTAEDVMDSWMNSPLHKENILSEKFEEIGVGHAGVYWVQNFGAIIVEDN